MALRRWARTIAVGLAVAAWLCLGLALPIVLSLYSKDVSSDAVEAAPGDAFTISHPVVLSNLPGVRVDRGTLAFIDGNGKALSSELVPGQVTLAPPSSSLRLFNGVISLGPDAATKPTPTSEFPPSPFIEALLANRFETLSVRQTTLIINGFFPAPETITDVKADVSLRRRGYLAIKGSGVLRGLPVNFDVLLNLGQAERSGAMLSKVPLRLNVKSEQIDLNFDGRMMRSGEMIEMEGQGDLAVSAGRGLARWFGSYWPSGGGLRDISVRGQMRISQQMLAFENAAVKMDGNECTGVLGLRLLQPRPVITATLAYKTFDMRPYLSGPRSTDPDWYNLSTLAAEALTVPLGMHLDADVRLSADRVQLSHFELGRTAASFALKDGRLLANVADVRFNGGEGGGQITADFRGPTPRVTLRGRLDQIDLATLGSSMPGSPQISGKAGVVADLVGSGVTIRDVVKGMAGRITVRGQSPVKLGLDLKSLAEAAKTDQSDGWTVATRGSTDFEKLDLKLVVRDGTLLTEAVEGLSSDGMWSAVGVVNLLSDRIDLRLTQSAPTAAKTPSIVAPRQAFDLQGTAQAPRVMKPASP